MVQDKSQALEPTLLPAVDQGQQNENSQELTPAQECSSNAVPDEAKAAQCEQSAPGLLEISAQVDALCILFAVALVAGKTSVANLLQLQAKHQCSGSQNLWVLQDSMERIHHCQ